MTADLCSQHIDLCSPGSHNSRDDGDRDGDDDGNSANSGVYEDSSNVLESWGSRSIDLQQQPNRFQFPSNYFHRSSEATLSGVQAKAKVSVAVSIG